MSAEEDLYTALSGHSGLDALVDGRIHVDKRDEDEDLPSVVYQHPGTSYINTIHGTVAATITTLGVSCVGASRADAEAVAAQVLAAVNGDFVPRDRASDYDPETQYHFTTITFIRHE